MIKAVNIKWDTDGDKEVLDNLPKEMIIPDELECIYKADLPWAFERISDWLSDETGFYHNGFKIENVITEEIVEEELFDFFNDAMETGEAPEIESVSRIKDTLKSTDCGIVLNCIEGKQIRLIIQVD